MSVQVAFDIAEQNRVFFRSNPTGSFHVSLDPASEQSGFSSFFLEKGVTPAITPFKLRVLDDAEWTLNVIEGEAISSFKYADGAGFMERLKPLLAYNKLYRMQAFGQYAGDAFDVSALTLTLQHERDALQSLNAGREYKENEVLHADEVILEELKPISLSEATAALVSGLPPGILPLGQLNLTQIVAVNRAEQEGILEGPISGSYFSDAMVDSSTVSTESIPDYKADRKTVEKYFSDQYGKDFNDRYSVFSKKERDLYSRFRATLTARWRPFLTDKPVFDAVNYFRQKYGENFYHRTFEFSRSENQLFERHQSYIVNQLIPLLERKDLSQLAPDSLQSYFSHFYGENYREKTNWFNQEELISWNKHEELLTGKPPVDLSDKDIDDIQYHFLKKYGEEFFVGYKRLSDNEYTKSESEALRLHGEQVTNLKPAVLAKFEYSSTAESNLGKSGIRPAYSVAQIKAHLENSESIKVSNVTLLRSGYFSEQDNPTWLFRGDLRKPEYILKFGFTSRGTNADIDRMVTTNKIHGFISTSKSFKVANSDFGKKGKSYIYLVENTPEANSIDIMRWYRNEHLRGIKNMQFDWWVTQQKEIAFKRTIDAARIKAVRLPTGEWKSNPHYVPLQPDRTRTPQAQIPGKRR